MARRIVRPKAFDLPKGAQPTRKSRSRRGAGAAKTGPLSNTAKLKYNKYFQADDEETQEFVERILRRDISF
jgi:hypothetical protein